MYTPDENPIQSLPKVSKLNRRLNVLSGNGNFSPLTPSFGILPLETPPSPCESTNHPSPPYVISSLSTLTEANDQKNNVKIVSILLRNSYTGVKKAA